MPRAPLLPAAANSSAAAARLLDRRVAHSPLLLTALFLPRAQLQPACSGQALPTSAPPPPRSPAPLRHRRPRSASATLHAAAPLPTAFAPTRPHSALLASAPLPGCCRTNYQAPTG